MLKQATYMKPTSRNTAWTIGTRVMRPHNKDAGIIVEASDRQIKVQWESGRTSYFRLGKVGNLLLAVAG